MLRMRILAVTTLFALWMAACAPVLTETPAPTPFMPVATEEPSIPVGNVAVVQSVEIQILESLPVQANVIVRGQLPDAGCTTISGVGQARDGSMFKLTLATKTDPLALCAQALTPFEQVVSLDVKDLPAARYTVEVQGITQTFELLTRDVTNFKETLVEALNSRDFDLLRLLMDESLVIAVWRSEGTAYAVEPAIEQLQLNYLNAAPVLTADSEKDLSALLGNLDPLSVFGIDVGHSFGLFVSGWGPEGRDEAVLYVNYLLDGSLYWHGVLIAPGGFAAASPILMEPLYAHAHPSTGPSQGMAVPSKPL